MIRSRYPFTSDPSIVAAQRGAALAKSIAATAVLGGILAIAVLAARDVQPRSGDGFIPAAVDRVMAHDSTTAAIAPAGELDLQSHLDSREVADYRSNVHG